MRKPQAPILRGRISASEFRWYGIDAKRYRAIMNHLEGKDFELTLQANRKKRSLNQNNWYWGCIIPMIQEAAGYETAEETHEALKWHFLQVHTGPMPTVKSTADLTTTEMVEYCERCRQLAAEMFGLYIPDPNEMEQVA